MLLGLIGPVFIVRWSTEKWSRVLFSDENSLFLDGPDVIQSYWHYLRNNGKVILRRQRVVGCDGWGAFSSHGCVSIFNMVGRQSTVYYLKVMKKVMIPFSDDNIPVYWIYQQDNALIHVSCAARKWFSINSLRLME